MKFLFLFILLFSCGESFAQSAGKLIDGTIAQGVYAPRNYVKNPSGFKNALNITTSSASIARDTDTADKLDGIASLVCDASSQNGYCLWSLDTIQEGDKTGNCEFKVTYKGDASLYKLRITDTSSTLTDSSVLSNVTDWTETSINYPCGSARDVRLVQTESGTGAAVNVGRVYYGKATNIGSSGYVGPWTSWTPTGTLTTNVTYTGKQRIVGDSKEYEVKLAFAGTNTQGALDINLPSGDVIDTAKMIDTQAASIIQGSSGIAFDVSVDLYPIHIGYNSTTVVSLYVIRDDKGDGSAYLDYGGVNTFTNAPFTIASGDYIIARWKVPIVGLGSNTSVGINCIGTSNCENVFSATVGSTGTVSGENVDWINGNCTNANPLVCTFNTSLFSAVASCTATAASGRMVNITANSTSSISIQGVDDAGAASQYGFHLICSRQSSDLKPRPQVPILVGSVSSNSTGAERIERATIAAPSGGSCAVQRQSGSWISGTPSSAGTGRCKITFTTAFSTIPTCVCISGTPNNCQIYDHQTTYFEYIITVSTTGSAANDLGNVICMGAR